MIYLKDKKGFTAYKLNQLGLPLTTGQNLMSGLDINPKATTLIKLSEIYNISIDDLLLKDLEKEE